jgi:hypothetical protein
VHIFCALRLFVSLIYLLDGGTPASHVVDGGIPHAERSQSARLSYSPILSHLILLGGGIPASHIVADGPEKRSQYLNSYSFTRS